jgi:hypothetical protein
LYNALRKGGEVEHGAGRQPCIPAKRARTGRCEEECGPPLQPCRKGPRGAHLVERPGYWCPQVLRLKSYLLLQTASPRMKVGARS